MNAPGSAASLVAQARVDSDGRLLAADPAIDALNARAGGAVGDPLAVPQLATAARLARRLGIPVSRGVVVADEDGDLDLWVRAEPDGDAVRLAVSGWRELPGWRPAASEPPYAESDWRWETDASLRLTFLSIEAAAAAGLDALALLGQPLTTVFALDEGEGACRSSMRWRGNSRSPTSRRGFARAGGRSCWRLPSAATARAPSPG